MKKPKPSLKCFLFIISFLSAVCVAPKAWTAGKLRIGYGAPTVSMAPLWVTKEAGIFEKNDLEVEALYLESALVQKALIAGDIQFAEMTGALMSAPRLQGADLVMLAGFQNRLLYRLIVRPEIGTVSDLKGKRVGVSRFGAGADQSTRLLLSKLGLDPQKDVTLLQVGGEPTRIAAIVGKSIDATVVQPPMHKKAAEAGMRILANMEEMDIPFQHTGLVTTQSFIAKEPAIVRRVVKSFIEGIHVSKKEAEVSKRAIRRYMRVKDERELQDTYEILKDLIPKKPYPTVEGFRIIFAELGGKIPAARTADPRDFVELRFLEELDRSGFIDGLYR